MSIETQTTHSVKTAGRKCMPNKRYRLPWPDNLLDRIFGENFHETNTVTYDQLAAIEYVTKTSLTKLQQDVIQRRYKDKMTLAQIAAIHNVSREYIRLIEAKALRLLCKPTRVQIIQMGLKAFYEQNIKNLYYTRQNILSTELSDNNICYASGSMRKTIKTLRENGFTTVGDLLLITPNDKHHLGLTQTKYNTIVVRYQTIIAEQNAVISALETHMGEPTIPVVPYPTNLFDAIYGKTDTVHTGALPTRSQIDGLNYIMEKNLNGVQRSIIYYIYEKGLTISACAQTMRIGANDIVRNHLRDALRILRQKPNCYAYIDGVSIENMYVPIEQNNANTAATPLTNTELHENIRNILGTHNIETVQELMARTDEELRAIPCMDEHMLREVKIKFPKRNAYACACAYLTSLRMSIDEQKIYLKSIRIDRLNIPCKTELKTANLVTAEDVFLSNDPIVTDEIRENLRVAVCLRATSIQNMPLSIRAINALTAANIHTFDELNNMTDEELLKIRNIGITTVQNIRTNLNNVMQIINRSAYAD